MIKNYFDTYTYLQGQKLNVGESFINGGEKQKAIFLRDDAELKEEESLLYLTFEKDRYKKIFFIDDLFKDNQKRYEAILSEIYKKDGLYFYKTKGLGVETILPFDMYFFLNISNGDLFKPLKAFGFDENTIKTNYNELMDLTNLVFALINFTGVEPLKEKGYFPKTYESFLEKSLTCFNGWEEIAQKEIEKVIERKEKMTKVNKEDLTTELFLIFAENAFLKETIKYIRNIAYDLATRISDLRSGKIEEQKKEALYPLFIQKFRNRTITEEITIYKVNAFDKGNTNKNKGLKITGQSKFIQEIPNLKSFTQDISLAETHKETLDKLNAIEKDINALRSENEKNQIGSKEREKNNVLVNMKEDMLLEIANNNNIVVFRGNYYVNIAKGLQIRNSKDDHGLCYISMENEDTAIKCSLEGAINTFFKSGTRSNNAIIYKNTFIYIISKIAKAHSKLNPFSNNAQEIPYLHFTGEEIYKIVTGKTYSKYCKANAKSENEVKAIEKAKSDAKKNFIKALRFIKGMALCYANSIEIDILQSIIDIDEVKKTKAKKVVIKDTDGQQISNGVAILPTSNFWSANIYGNKEYGSYFYIADIDKTENVEELALALSFSLAVSNSEKTLTKPYTFAKLCEYLCIEPPTLKKEDRDNRMKKKAFSEELRRKKDGIYKALAHLKEIGIITFKEQDYINATKPIDFEFKGSIPIKLIIKEKKDEKAPKKITNKV